MTELFEKNLAQSILISPLFCDPLRKQSLENIELIEESDQKTNLKAEPIGFYHDENNPLEEAENLWQKALCSGKNVIICYGLGLGYLFDVAEDWLKENNERFLVFFEPDLKVIAAFLHSKRAEKIVQCPQVKIFPYLEPHESLPNGIPEMFMTNYLWSFIGKTYLCLALPSYYKHKERGFKKFERLISDAFHKVELTQVFLTKTSYKVLINFLQNSISNVPNTSRTHLQGKFKNVPAVICGAGASILEDVDLIKTLQDKALIFAGGTSVTVLNNHGIEPHIGGIIDPDPNLPNFIKQSSFEMPFLYKSRSGCEIISRHHGHRIWTPDIYESSLTEWISKKLHNEKEDGQNFWTVTDFLVDQAALLGCNPIILVGIDLAMTENRYYADSDLLSLNTDRILIDQPDRDGNPIKTKWDWVYAAEKISQIAACYPHIQFINATNKGLGFKGIPNHSLATCVEKHCRHSIDPQALLYANLLNAPLRYADVDNIHDSLNLMNTSLKKCLDLLHKLEMELSLLFSNWQIKTLDELNPYEGEMQTLYSELEKEIAYKELLSPNWKTYRKTLHKQSGIPENPLKYKLTLFGMRVREFQYFKGVAIANSAILELSLSYLKDIHKMTIANEEATYCTNSS